MASGDRSIWISNNSNDFNDGDNWSNGVPGSVGAQDPNAYFGGPSGGQANCTLNVDRTGDTFLLTTAPEYGGDIGSVGVPLIWSDVVGPHVIRGSGRVYVKPAVGVASIVVDSTNIEDALTILSSVPVVWIKSGAVIVAPTGQLTSHCGVVGIDASLTINAPSGAETNPLSLVVIAGQVDNDRATENGDYWHISGGFVKCTNETFATGHVIGITGGTLELSPTGVAGQVNLLAIGGTVDFSQSLFTINLKVFVLGPNVLFKDVTVGASSDSEIDLRKPYP